MRWNVENVERKEIKRQGRTREEEKRNESA